MMRKLIIWAIVIGIAVVWSSVIYKSCKNNKNTPNTSVTNSSTTGDRNLANVAEEEEEEEEESVTDEYDDRAMNQGKSQSTDDAEKVDMTNLEEDEDEEEEEAEDVKIEFTKDEDSTTGSNGNTANNSISTSDEDNWKYLVVAGAYINKSNAKIMLSKLKKIGYQEAEIVRFDYDEHYAISVGRYNTMSAANSTSKELKADHRIDNYVHEKRVKKKKR
ncbi:MAG: SPOR domain-containing protein [Saprospiraceae bacterium]